MARDTQRTGTGILGNDSPQQSALIVEAESGIGEKPLAVLKQAGFAVQMVANGQAAVSILEHKAFNLALVDCALTDMDGLAVLDRIKHQSPDTDVIVVSSSPSVEEAVAAIHKGAADYMARPVDTEKLAARLGHLKAERGRSPAAGLQEDHGIDGGLNFITRNPAMMQLLEAAKHVAGTQATVLITGESGTGKEVLARFIHRAADRPGRPLVAVNCAALPETLIESELFGHEKGAFTGAAQRKIGKFEQVGEGTLILDEIGDMPLALQPKILRVLQERRIERLGGGADRSFNGQVIALTNQDLAAAVKAGRFREDLYYRINVVPFHLPPLRARRDDIPLLTRHFITKYETLYAKRFDAVEAHILERMCAENWRGNVRELENRIERAVLLSPAPQLDDALLADGNLTLQTADDDAVIRAGLSVRGMEKILISKTMQAVNQNRAKASELLGISVRTLRNKLNEYKACQDEVRREALP